MKNTLFNIILCFLPVLGFAQKNEKKEQEAYELSQKAIELIDFGKTKQSIDLLKQAIKLDPNNYNYTYELGYAYYLTQDYDNSIKVYKKATKLKEASEETYQLLGNVYEAKGQFEEALKIYNKGLNKFPSSGELYYEKGNMYKDKKEGLKYYEKGIQVDPMYADNYYELSKYFLNETNTEMWGLFYAELFMNIERSSARTEEIGKLILKKYQSEIKISPNKIYQISFYQNENQSNNGKPTFGSSVFEPIFTSSLSGIDSININSLHIIRTKFIQNYWDKNYFQVYKNILFDWQKMLIERGLFDCYNYWLLSKGDKEEFHDWYEKNNKRYDDFLAWFSQNKLLLTDKNFFIRFEN